MSKVGETGVGKQVPIIVSYSPTQTHTNRNCTKSTVNFFLLSPVEQLKVTYSELNLCVICHETVAGIKVLVVGMHVKFYSHA